jgi:NTP pyrophosphatase (non-canonical NTP hydrolase)
MIVRHILDLLKNHLNNIVNKSWNYAGRCKTWQDEIGNAGFGLVGEAGEVADQIKKMLYHTEKPLEFHREKITQELGDVVFYFLKLSELMGISLEDIVKANREKLESRHPELGKVEARFADGYIK